MATTLEQQVSGMKLEDKTHLKDKVEPPTEQKEKQEENGKDEGVEEDPDDVAILTNILENDSFKCCLGDQCLVGDPGLKKGKVTHVNPWNTTVRP